MKTIRLIALALLMTGTSLYTFAGANNGPKGAKKAIKLEDKINRKTESMARELGLSEDQQNKVYSLLLSRQGKIDQLKNGRKNEQLTEAERNTIKTIRSEYKKEIAGILSPEQLAKWKQNRKLSKERHQKIDADPQMPENKREPSDLE